MNGGYHRGDDDVEVRPVQSGRDPACNNTGWRAWDYSLLFTGQASPGKGSRYLASAPGTRDKLSDMNQYPVLLTVLLSALLWAGGAAFAANAFGFGVGVPGVYPIDWAESFPYLSAEVFTDSNLSVLFTIGTYPADFPTGFETGASLLAKGWSGPIAIYAGGGTSVYWNWIAASSAWSWSPYMNMIAGVQWRILEPLAISFQVRSLDPIPLTFTLHPEYSLGVSLVFGRGLPLSPQVDQVTLWIIVGLGVLALVAYYPRT